ncbi:MAG: hypothetical protein KatS3mg083_131 [Candidatus Dojkabacteria bacterium]|nr:MAG: hypothetical protein KatS3mg083_131 [Candidatus Dojkabacteria bacterium]
MDDFNKRREECAKIVLFLLETCDVAQKIQYALSKYNIEMRVIFQDMAGNGGASSADFSTIAANSVPEVEKVEVN